MRFFSFFKSKITFSIANFILSSPSPIRYPLFALESIIQNSL